MSDSTGKDGALQALSAGLDRVSGKLTVIALVLACAAALLSFALTLSLAILPYVTLTHTSLVGGAVALVAFAAVFSVVSRPADVVDKASWAVWLARLGLKMAGRFHSRRLAKQDATGQDGAGKT